MQSFSYRLRDVRVEFGAGRVRRMGDVVEETLGSKRILLVSTPGRGESVERVRASLGVRVAGEFAGARLHVPTDVVASALTVARESGADCVVAVGGGSAIGLGKALVREIEVPLVAVPTTYSGSEMTDIWGVTDAEGKTTGRDARVAPRVVVYDPDLTRGMPLAVAAPSGINAIAHSVEALYSASASPVSNAVAKEGIRLLASALRVLAFAGRDGAAAPAEARADAFCGAHLCALALDATTMGLHHKLCHVLGGTLDLPHALTHAVLLPYTSAYNSAAAPGAMKAVADALGVPDAPLGLWQLNRDIGVTQTLADLGVVTTDLSRVAHLATQSSYANPAPVETETVVELLQRALVGEPPDR